MDVEQLRKINQLSHELKRHGMAESATDAYTQAQQIITITPKPQTTGQETVVVEAQAVEPLAARQFQIELERVHKAVIEEMDLMRNTINQVIAEVNAMRDELGKLQAAPTVAPKPKEKQVELKTEEKVPHPRQGNFQPGDVDIQKMFYYGTKK